jgi:phage shock protein A
MEAKADQRLAQADAMAELSSQDLDTRFSDLESQQEVDDDLSALKKQMGK